MWNNEISRCETGDEDFEVLCEFPVFYGSREDCFETNVKIPKKMFTTCREIDCRDNAGRFNHFHIIMTCNPNDCILTMWRFITAIKINLPNDVIFISNYR